MDIQSLMRQAQEMQKKIQKMQEELAKALYEGTSGGGMIKITITGNKETKKVEIDPSLIKNDEKEILEDLLVAAWNDAHKKAEDESANSMNSITNGMKLPGGLKI